MCSPPTPSQHVRDRIPQQESIDLFGCSLDNSTAPVARRNDPSPRLLAQIFPAPNLMVRPAINRGQRHSSISPLFPKLPPSILNVSTEYFSRSNCRLGLDFRELNASNIQDPHRRRVLIESESRSCMRDRECSLEKGGESCSSCLAEGVVNGLLVHPNRAQSAGKEDATLPYLVYLQGGPGFESPRPMEASGWVKKACEEYRVLLLDQRGTGLSTPLTTSSLSQITPAAEQVEYLKHFRADNIVKDAEFIRLHLVPEGKPWTILGQSYGGFCAVTYLSFAPEGLKSVLLTGGLPPLGKPCTADNVYRACFKQVQLQNEKYYKRYPQDIQVIHEVVRYLSESEGGGVLLPSGGRLTPKMLQCLGLSGLGSGGGFERLHYLLERVWDPILVPGAKKNISYYFLKEFEMWLGFDQNPLYALLHESIYCEGSSSKWSADKIFSEYGNLFDPVKATEEGRPVYLTGEMVFPCFFDEINALRPLKEAAHLLAEKEDWPPLYDISVLNNNKVPVAAAVYYEDMYVNFNIAKETASQIAGIRLWVTNEYMHSGLRDGGSHVFEHLMGLLKGKKPLF